MKIIYTQRELEDIVIAYVQALHARGKKYPDGSSAYVSLPSVQHSSECTHVKCSCGGDALFEQLSKATGELVKVEKYSGRES